MTRPSPKTRKEAAELAARVEQLQRYRWRVGVVDGYWRVARSGPGIDGWETLPERLEHNQDDVVADRFEQAAWLKRLLGHTSAWQNRDYDAARDGREVYELVILR